MDNHMREYTTCDQCLKNCSVEALRCDVGKRHYEEVTGMEYAPVKEVEVDDGAAYRKMIRERRARKNSRQEGRQ